METLEVIKSNAVKAFNNTNESGKTLLSNLFGKEVFNQKITDRIKTPEDAYTVLGYKSVLFSGPNDEIAYQKLKLIAQALNEGWKPDLGNDNEPKYYPWFNFKGGFSYYGAYCSCTGSHVGSRLCFKSRELAEYAGKQFISIYKDFMTF